MVVLIACGREAVPPAVVPAPVVIPPSPVVGPKSPVVHTGIAGRVVLDGKPVTDFVVLAADNFTLTFWRDPPVPVHSLDGRFRVATAGTHDVVIAGRGFARRGASRG